MKLIITESDTVAISLVEEEDGVSVVANGIVFLLKIKPEGVFFYKEVPEELGFTVDSADSYSLAISEEI